MPPDAERDSALLRPRGGARATAAGLRGIIASTATWKVRDISLKVKYDYHQNSKLKFEPCIMSRTEEF